MLLSCNRPNAACGIETLYQKSYRSRDNCCNRPNAACGIETPYISTIGVSMKVATDLMPLAASKHIKPKLTGIEDNGCNRPNAACGIETGRLMRLRLMLLRCNRPNSACGIETSSPICSTNSFSCNRPNAACGIETVRPHDDVPVTTVLQPT